MPLDWKYSTDGVDWEELSALYRMKTAMAIFQNQQQQLERGYLSEQ
ncbi:MAG TPA: hypothetical protein VKB41_12905 [Steroidobacteraceae bacterium]|nr:hypothetical protein [Steroidobacteraceae bacterium]